MIICLSRKRCLVIQLESGDKQPALFIEISAFNRSLPTKFHLNMIIRLIMSVPEVSTHFYIVSYYMNKVKTSWTYSAPKLTMINKASCLIILIFFFRKQSAKVLYSLLAFLRAQ